MEFSKNEARRLEALAHYDILDSAYEDCFDRITQMAAVIFDAPIALITLVDERRQWFKSALGLDMRETPREVSFCAHAILTEHTLVVPDAMEDKRFKSNPLVEYQPHIRFYAGAPLITPDGYAIGTLCIIDHKPRPGLESIDQGVLESLSKLVVDLMEGRKAVKQIEAK